MDTQTKTKNKKSVFEKLNSAIITFEHYAIATGMILISAIIFINVIGRYFFDTSFTWPEELSRYIIVAVTFIGLSACARDNIHVSVDILSNKLKGRAAWAQQVVINLICIALAAYLSVISIRFTGLQYLGGNVSVALPIPTWVLYLSVSIGFVLATYTYSVKTVQLIKNKKDWETKEVEK
ncbi:MAG: TRAP transporter small permease [Eubacteriales bacterium]|nr:TRAP transporter small permease [Eubacteriales bacterium]